MSRPMLVRLLTIEVVVADLSRLHILFWNSVAFGSRNVVGCQLAQT